MAASATRAQTPGMSRTLTRTTVGIVGGGPAGLMLGPPAGRSPASSRVVVEIRTRREIEETHRAGILEQDSVRLLVDSGVSDRVLREGDEHEGIDLAFGGSAAPDRLPGARRRLLPALPADRGLHGPRRRPRAGRAATCGSASATCPWSTSTTARPGVLFTDADGRRPRAALRLPRRRRRLPQHLPAGGAREPARAQYFREYPFAWFGILCEAPASAPELIYNHSDARLRADQPAHADAAADVLPVRPGRRRGGLVRRPDLGGAPVPPRRQRAHAARGADHLEVGAAVPQLRPGADAPRQPAARRRRRAHRPAHRAPRASTSRSPT